MSMDANDNLLGMYLRDRRTKLDPAALGLPVTRRRTPGLRREEVAQRANVSATWYTWLEQGRGGAPSANVLDRIARALMLTDVEREHLFLIGLGRPPEVRYQAPNGVTPRMQRVLDAMEFSPALVRTSTWDIVAWNRAAQAVLTDYAALAPRERNILRLIFLDAHVRAAQPDWESVARFVVAAFRADAARSGAAKTIQAFVDELSQLSPEFDAMWRANDVRANDEGTKTIVHPLLGLIELEYSAFAVHGRPDLSLVVYTPASEVAEERVKLLISRYADGVGV
ncbi:helix-turn-helix domain-containing protein [Paraburkholderia sp. Tr-20389]|uniref:helix-turn-helix transcriptional regulator n=1 Tax=Paraburkholderia sp. Tr-20389 TaxID=2703903 RepID=UPI00197D9EC8|nr:helix-turn-helix transcriptional regulator [Paraburkholderia sp. Tr-20389]MBN3751970.1 helix-turn-helix domain-containing protein [Paraburkholderia sp. Tr-20389]